MLSAHQSHSLSLHTKVVCNLNKIQFYVFTMEDTILAEITESLQNILPPPRCIPERASHSFMLFLFYQNRSSHKLYALHAVLSVY